MRRYRRRRTGIVLMLLVALAYSAQPLDAFNHVAAHERSVSASIVNDGSAYTALSGGTCTSVPTSSGTCTFTITNLGTTGQTYTVTLQEDANSAVGTYAVTGATAVSSGGVSTPSEIAVGSDTTLTANLADCPTCSGTTVNVYWKVEGNKAGVMDSDKTRHQMTITYA